MEGFFLHSSENEWLIDGNLQKWKMYSLPWWRTSVGNACAVCDVTEVTEFDFNYFWSRHMAFNDSYACWQIDFNHLRIVSASHNNSPTHISIYV